MLARSKAIIRRITEQLSLPDRTSVTPQHVYLLGAVQEMLPKSLNQVPGSINQGLRKGPVNLQRSRAANSEA